MTESCLCTFLESNFYKGIVFHFVTVDSKCDVTVKNGQEPQSRINTMLNAVYPKCSRVENLLIL